MNLALNHVHTQHGYDGNVTFAVDHTFKVLQTAACTLPAKPSSHKASSYSTLCDGGLQQTPLSGTGPHTTMCCCGGLHHTTFQCAGPHTTSMLIREPAALCVVMIGLHHTTFQCAGPHTTSMLILGPAALIMSQHASMGCNSRNCMSTGCIMQTTDLFMSMTGWSSAWSRTPTNNRHVTAWRLS